MPLVASRSFAPEARSVPAARRRTAAGAPARPARGTTPPAAPRGRPAAGRDEPDGAVVLVLGGGSCRMSCGDGALHLAAAAPDDEALTRVEHVVGSHLERFAAAEGLTVSWERTPWRPGL